MRIELACDVPSLVNLEIVRRKQRSQYLANFALAGTPSAAQHDRRPKPFARLLNDVRHPAKHVREKAFVAAADVRKEVIAEHAIRASRRGLHVEASPEIQVVRSARRPVGIRIELDAIVLAAIAVGMPSL